MEFKEFLNQNRKGLIDKWYRAVLETYPAEAVEIFGRDKDRFQNPVGYNVAEAVKALFDYLNNESGADAITGPLDMLIRIRSVQDYTPSQAVACIFLIKDIVRKELGPRPAEFRLHDELLKFESRVDQLMLKAFDNYMQCRQNLFEVRIREAKAGTFRLIDKLNRRPDKRNAAE
jgi:hypothetical protein